MGDKNGTFGFQKPSPADDQKFDRILLLLLGSLLNLAAMYNAEVIAQMRQCFTVTWHRNCLRFLNVFRCAHCWEGQVTYPSPKHSRAVGLSFHVFKTSSFGPKSTPFGPGGVFSALQHGLPELLPGRVAGGAPHLDGHPKSPGALWRALHGPLEIYGGVGCHGGKTVRFNFKGWINLDKATNLKVKKISCFHLW